MPKNENENEAAVEQPTAERYPCPVPDAFKDAPVPYGADRETTLNYFVPALKTWSAKGTEAVQVTGWLIVTLKARDDLYGTNEAFWQDIRVRVGIGQSWGYTCRNAYLTWLKADPAVRDAVKSVEVLAAMKSLTPAEAKKIVASVEDRPVNIEDVALAKKKNPRLRKVERDKETRRAEREAEEIAKREAEAEENAARHVAKSKVLERLQDAIHGVFNLLPVEVLTEDVRTAIRTAIVNAYRDGALDGENVGHPYRAVVDDAIRTAARARRDAIAAAEDAAAKSEAENDSLGLLAARRAEREAAREAAKQENARKREAAKKTTAGLAAMGVDVDGAAADVAAKRAKNDRAEQDLNAPPAAELTPAK